MTVSNLTSHVTTSCSLAIRREVAKPAHAQPICHVVVGLVGTLKDSLMFLKSLMASRLDSGFKCHILCH